MDFMNNFVNAVYRILLTPEYSKYFTTYTGTHCCPSFTLHYITQVT